MDPEVGLRGRRCDQRRAIEFANQMAQQRRLRLTRYEPNSVHGQTRTIQISGIAGPIDHSCCLGHRKVLAVAGSLSDFRPFPRSRSYQDQFHCLERQRDYETFSGLLPVADSSVSPVAYCACAGQLLVSGQCDRGRKLPSGNSANTWDVSGAGDSTIQGFTTDISVNVGQTVSFKINTNATNYKLDIYRLGYYGGAGAHLVTTITPSAQLPSNSAGMHH